MNGSIVVTPGYIFRNNQDITTANLNAWTTPTAVLEDESITKYEIDYEVVGPEQTIISTSSATLTLALDQKKIVHVFSITLNQNITTLTITGGAGGQLIDAEISNSGGYTITIPAGHYLVNGTTSPITPGNPSFLRGWHIDSTWMWSINSFA